MEYLCQMQIMAFHGLHGIFHHTHREHMSLQALWMVEDTQSALLHVEAAEEKAVALAKAYSLSLELRGSLPEDPWWGGNQPKYLAKSIAFYIREMLIVAIAMESQVRLTELQFEGALQNAFGQQYLPAQLRSQMHLARTAICRHGKNRKSFMTSAARMYFFLSSEELNEVFGSYQRCLQSLPLPRQLQTGGQVRQ